MSIFLIIFVSTFTNSFTAPQVVEIQSVNQAEIPDQFEKQSTAENVVTSTTQKTTDPPTTYPLVSPDVIINEHSLEKTVPNANKEVEALSFTTKIYTMVAIPVQRFMATPKVNTVLRNIGTCVVNGAMELIAHFFPTPLMPLIASAAGMIIPFEPVVMLKERMPVTSYRRAIKTALDSFLGTFEKYKVDDNEDPYMTRQFYRRVMNNGDVKKKKAIKYD